MKLWILRPVSLPQVSDPWDPPYDKSRGFVVRAETEQDAREVADANGGDENEWLLGVHPWLDASYSTCRELTTDGPEYPIMNDFRAG